MGELCTPKHIRLKFWRCIAGLLTSLILRIYKCTKSKISSFRMWKQPQWLKRCTFKSGRNALQVNMHRLTETDFRSDVTISKWRPWSQFMQQSAATWWMDANRLPSTYAAATVSSWSIVIYSKFKTQIANLCLTRCRSDIHSCYQRWCPGTCSTTFHRQSSSAWSSVAVWMYRSHRVSRYHQRHAGC